MTAHQKLGKALNITLLTTSFPRFKGDYAGHFVSRYAHMLARSGYKVKVVAPHDPEVKDNPLYGDVEVSYFRYFFPQRFQTLAYGAGIISRIRKNIFRVLLIPFFMASFFFAAHRAGKNSDLIQAYWAPAGIVALAVKFFKNIPVVINLWGSDFLLLRFPGFATVFRGMLRRADAILCESEHFKDILQQIGIPENKISVLPNGIDLDIFQPGNKTDARKELNLPDNQTLIVHIGSLSPVKGQKYLIEAIPEIISKDKNVKFIIIGDGELRKQLESQARAGDLSPYVLFAGTQKASRIPLWLKAADIFVLPSLSEGNPNVLLEAMASGLPIVSTRVGGIPGMIREGQEGLLGPPKSTKTLAQNIMTLIEDKPLRERLGQKGLKTVRENYGNWETQSAQLQAIYQNLTAG